MRFKVDKDFIEKKLEKKSIEKWDKWVLEFNKVLLDKLSEIKINGVDYYSIDQAKIKFMSEISNIAYPHFIKKELDKNWDEVSSKLDDLAYLLKGLKKEEIKTENEPSDN
jgi:leucyl aminopeptidase (aminopeptidase T)